MEAMDVLRIHYGQAHLVARSLIESLKNLPHLDDDKNEGLGKKLLKFSTKLINVQATLKSYKREADINSSETIKILVAKLPQFGINEWKKAAVRIYENGKEPDLDDFIKCIKHLETHTYSEVRSQRERKFPPKPEFPKDKQKRPFSGAPGATQSKVTTMSTDARQSNPQQRGVEGGEKLHTFSDFNKPGCGRLPFLCQGSSSGEMLQIL